MRLFFNKKKKILGLGFCLLLFLLFVPQTTSAAWDPLATLGVREGVDTLIIQTIYFVLGLIINLLGNALTLILTGLRAFVSPQDAGAGILLDKFPFIYELWQQTLNFVNMSFIVLLIVTAFGTIFNLEKERLTYKTLLIPIITVAFFINFSFTLAENVIHFSNQMSSLFLNMIETGFGTKTKTDFTQVIMSGLGLTTFLENTESFVGNTTAATTAASGIKSTDAPAVDVALNVIIRSVMFIILASIAAIALLSALVFAAVRIPILWLILILAPIAFVGYVIPKAKGETYDKWVSNLLSWSFFLPVFLFFVMLAVVFISRKPPSIIGFSSGSFLTITNDLLGTLFYYGLTITFIFMGLGAALKMKSYLGDPAAKGLNPAKAFSYIEKNMPIFGVHRRALSDALQRTKTRLTEEGVPIPFSGGKTYGGEKAYRLSQQKLGADYGNILQRRVLGFKEDTTNQNAILKQTKEELDSIGEKFKQGALTQQQIIDQALRASANDAKSLAYAKFAAENGWLENSEFLKILEKLKGNKFAIEDFVRSYKEKDFGKVDAATLLSFAEGTGNFGRDSSYTGARQTVYGYIQSKMGENGRLADALTQDQYEKGIQLLGRNSGGFTKAVEKIRPDIVAKSKQPGSGSTLTKLFEDILNTKTSEDVSKFRVETFGQPEFEEALTNHLEREINNAGLATPAEKLKFFDAYRKKINQGADSSTSRGIKNTVLGRIKAALGPVAAGGRGVLP